MGGGGLCGVSSGRWGDTTPVRGSGDTIGGPYKISSLLVFFFLAKISSPLPKLVLLSHVGLIEGSRRALVRRNAPPSLLEGRTQNGQHGGRCRLNKDGFKTYLDDQRKRRGWTMWRKKKKNRNLARTGDLGPLIAESAGPISWLGIAVSGFQEHLLTETKGCATTASTRSDAASCLSSGSRPQARPFLKKEKAREIIQEQP